MDCYVYSPVSPIPAPSTDAIDIDACSYVHIKNCYFSVNDDGIALKGGKGPYADTVEENGSNERILIEDCFYNYCHGCLTCGSEAIHNKNILLRRIKVNDAVNLLWLKMRPDTPQHYEWITVDDASGHVENFININPWTQFFDLKGRTDKPMSTVSNIEIKDCDCSCYQFFNVSSSRDYHLRSFSLKDLKIQAENKQNGYNSVEDISLENVTIE